MSTIGSIRLVGDITDGAGVVEILTIVGWSTICPDNRWTSSVANTICGYLGYESGTSLMCVQMGGVWEVPQYETCFLFIIFCM